MSRRRPIENALFYPTAPGQCRSEADALLGDPLSPDPQGESLIAGIVPHAGWSYSGAIAARVFRTLRERSRAATVILFGAVHYPGVTSFAAYPDGSWETPLGSIEVDARLASHIEEACQPTLILDAESHDREHSLEVQLPFIRWLWPDGRIVPIAAPPGRGASDIGRRIGELTRDENVIAVGSTDLTHYGPRFSFEPAGRGEAGREWMRQNDQRMIRRMLALADTEIEPEAAAHHNACGAGAITATLAFARAHGRNSGTLLDHTTSYDISPESEFTSAVGYAGLII